MDYAFQYFDYRLSCHTLFQSSIFHYNTNLCNFQIIIQCLDGFLDEIRCIKVYLIIGSLIDTFPNAVYAKHFSKDFPARSAVAVKSLPKNALLEIETIAAL